MLIDHLLEGIFTVNGINKASEEEKILYLKSLRKSATRLWQSFQNQDDVFDYLSEEKQECYLLRYFYPYSTFLAQELSQLEESYFEQKNSYSVSFFGAGPAPELIGLLHFFSDLNLKLNKKNIKKLEVNLFDKNESWSYSRKIINNHIIPKYWDLQNIDINPYVVDFCSESFWKYLENRDELILKSDLVVFQNCLNEISASDYGQTTANISGILNHLSDGSLIVFIDQEFGKYQTTSYMLDQINKIANITPDIYFVKPLNTRTMLGSGLISDYPEIINGNLYYKNMSDIGYLEGLVLRKDYPYSSLILECTRDPF